MAELSTQEFLEKYGDVQVSFNGATTYFVWFIGLTPEGHRLEISVRGDEIWRYDVNSNKLYSTSSVAPSSGVVWNKLGDEVDSFYEY